MIGNAVLIRFTTIGHLEVRGHDDRENRTLFSAKSLRPLRLGGEERCLPQSRRGRKGFAERSNKLDSFG